jgi:hypothetical protein
MEVNIHWPFAITAPPLEIAKEIAEKGLWDPDDRDP